MMRQCRQEAELAPNTRFVSVADSEADIYELLVDAQAEPRQFDWIVRACQDRALDGGDERETEQGQLNDTRPSRIRELVSTTEVLFTHSIHVRGREPKVSCEDRGRRQPRKSRKAEVEVRAARVSLRPPWRPDRKLPPVEVNVVLVSEIDPPADEPPVEWMLLTSMPIDDAEQVRQVIEYYCVRWTIEVFFRTLKSGCRVEGRRFEQTDRLLPCLALYLIVTWRTLYVCRLGREFPDISCEAIFDPAEWRSVYRVVRRESPPTEPPSLSQMVRMVAQLGGYVNRKNRPDEPGAQTVWLGLQRMHDIALCWDMFGPEAKTRRSASLRVSEMCRTTRAAPWALQGDPFGVRVPRRVAKLSARVRRTVHPRLTIHTLALREKRAQSQPPARARRCSDTRRPSTKCPCP